MDPGITAPHRRGNRPKWAAIAAGLLAVATGPAHAAGTLLSQGKPNIGNVTGIPSLCIPNLGLQDGPDGLGGVTQMPSGNNDGTNQASAVSLASSSSVAVVFASDNYGNEEHDSTSLNLPTAGSDNYNQDALISAVAAANPHTIVVLNDNSAILMPWLSQVPAVFEGFYDGQQWGTAISALLFGDVNPSGKLPMTFPTSRTALPASTTAQWPGTNGQIQYSEGLDVGYRWYDANNVTPLFPFGFGLSYTGFSYSNLHVGALSGGTATVTNTGSRAGTDVAQLYVSDPASVGEPPHHLKGFQRVTLNAGASTTVTFTIATHDLAHWDTGSNAWVATAGTYQILVGDSSRNLPLSGPITVSATVTANAGTAGSTSATVVNPYGAQSRRGIVTSLQIADDTGETYTAGGLPAGLSISSSGRITGTGTTPGTSTVTVTGTAVSGASSTVTFVWTIS